MTKAKAKIIKTRLPANSALNSIGISYDYVDSFLGTLTDKQHKLTSTDICKAFFSSSPKWIGKLFSLRNKIVSVFGLKTAVNPHDRQQQLKQFTCEPGKQFGLFKVFAKTDTEVVLGEDDKHLNFRVSPLLDTLTEDNPQRHLTISTTVVFNNWFGRLYFLPVRPFHKFVAPAMLKAMIRELENN